MNKKLQRDTENALLGGVLSGLARYFSHDPLLFRLLAIVLIVITGLFPGAFLYLLAWILIPKQTDADYIVNNSQKE